MRLVILPVVLAALAAAVQGAESKDVLLERAIYKEETAGDIEAAIRLYRQIVAISDAERAVTAQALYRLGLCLERRGRKDEARDAFERLVREFSDQADLAAKVRARVAPKLLPVPWADGEALWIGGRMPDSDRYAGHEVHVAAKGGGGRTWVLSRHRVSAYGRSLDSLGGLVRLEADVDTFVPIRCEHRERAPNVSFEVRYTPGRAEVTMKGVTAAVALKAPAFDSGQVLPLLRRLPLAPLFNTVVPVFSSSSGVVDARIQVVGRETVTVPAGTFDCYKVTVSMGPVHAREEPYWISADAHRYPVREGSSYFRDLTKIARWDPAALTPFDDEAWGVSVTPPRGWVFARSQPRENETSFTAGFASPDAEVSCSVEFRSEAGYGWRREWLPREAAGHGLRSKATARPTHTVRDASWTDAPVAGLPAARYLADYRDAPADKDMTEYAAYVRSQATFADVSCRAEKAVFEGRKAEMEALMESLRLP
jgi:hypothetical protein